MRIKFYYSYDGGGATPDDLRRRRILLVDDSLPFLRNFSSVLESQGYLVKTADSGLRAVELAASFNPDLISLDYDMPDLDGMRVLLKIRENQPNARVIFISGKMSLEAVELALARGASKCITKPVNIKELISVVESLIRQQS